MEIRIMRNLLIIIVFLLESVLSFSQVNEHGIPFITNYSIKDYKASEQNWAAIQDFRGMLYVGNQDAGVLEYDGESWRKIKLSNNSSTRSLAIDSSGNIFVGAVGEFGKLVPNTLGFLEYESLIPLLDSTERNFGDIWRTYASKEAIYFTTFYKIYKYDYNTISVFELPKGSIFSFLVNGRLYCASVFSGLNVYNDQIKDFEVVEGGDYFVGKRLASIISYKDSCLLIGGYEKGCFIYDQRTGITQALHASLKNDNSLLRSGLYHGAQVSDNAFAYATMFKGLSVMDSMGAIFFHIDQHNGLQDNKSTYVYSNTESEESPEWILLNNGISKIEINNPIKSFNHITDINDIISFENELFVATGEGVFRKKIDDQNKPFLDKIEGYVGISWSFCHQEDEHNLNTNSLFFSASDGVYRIKKNTAEKIIAKQECRAMYFSKAFSNRLYIGTGNGLVLAINNNDKWIDRGHFGELPFEIHNITEDAKGYLWLGTYLNGVIKSNQNDTTFVKYGIEHGLPCLNGIQLSIINDEVVCATDNGLFRFDEISNYFYPYKHFGDSFSNGEKGVLKLIPDKNGNIWAISFHEDKHWIEKVSKNQQDQYSVDNTPFKRLPNMTFQSVYTDDENITWIGGPDGLFSFDNDYTRTYNTPYNTYIRKVMVGRDSIVFGGTNFYYDDNENPIILYKHGQNKAPVFEYDQNIVSFEFATPFFENEEANLYRWKLDGFDKQWNNWSFQNKTTYNNLFEGEYTFLVKAKNIYELESEIANYTFIIKPPYYRTKIAMLIYLLLFILGIRSLVKYNVRRLKREKIYLEGVVKERTAEVVQQKEKIELAYQNVKLLSKIGQDVTANLSVEKIVGVVYENVNTLMDASILAIGLKNKYSNNLDFLGKEEQEGALLRMSDSLDDEGFLSTKCFNNQKEIIINDFSIENAETAKAYAEEQKQRKSLIYLPLTSKEKTIGVITVQTYEANAYTEYHVNILRNLAVYTSIALDNAEAYQQIAKQKQEITDSIQYAKRIQNAILPPLDQITASFPNHFIFFKPRNIVSGDFYWMKQIKQYSVIAAADCTGHGVPGAFMSMLGISFLNEIAGREDINHASEILNELRNYVKVSLRQTGKEGEAKDGMDIALCVIDNTNLEVQYSGAYNPFLLYRDNELMEIKADKMPIGIHIREKDSFTNNGYQLQKGDVFYLFSDGYPDQFGGEFNRKFKMKRFKDLLFDIHLKPMQHQKEILAETLADWMGDGEQIDDITIIGIQI